eukprot:scaffold105969_cov34-Tisochrysis_lutea.AAC.1
MRCECSRNKCSILVDAPPARSNAERKWSKSYRNLSRASSCDLLRRGDCCELSEGTDGHR